MLSRLSGIGTDTSSEPGVRDSSGEDKVVVAVVVMVVVVGYLRRRGLWTVGDNGNHMRARRGSVFVFISRGYRSNRQSGTVRT